MTYWLLTSEYPPQFGGGIGTYCYHWCRQLVTNKVAITVFIPDKNEKSVAVSWQDGVRIVAFSPYLSGTSAYLGYETMISYSFASVVETFMQKEGVPDWLESQEYNGIAYYTLQKKELGYELFKKLKVVITCHCPSSFYFAHNHINTYQLPYFWIGEMERFSIAAADVCISPSRYLVNYLQQQFTHITRPYEVIYNPYPLQNEPAEEITTPGKEVVFIGKLSPAKGILQTLKAFSRLWQAGSTVTLKLVGDADYFYHAAGSTMGAYIKKKYGNFVQQGLLQITGIVPPNQVRQHVQAARVILVPSTLENLPYTAIESMALGKVVLASAQGGQAELIQDGVNGFLFDHTIENSFEEKLQVVLKLDNAQLIAMGGQAKKAIAEKCDPEQHYHKKMQVLQGFTSVDNTEALFPFISKPLQQQNTLAGYPAVKGLLSVVVPYYNLGSYVAETIASILSSSYKNIEVLVVDDGSTEEGSRQVLQQLQKHAQVKVITQPNKGLSATRNRGAAEARGEFLAFLDADDTVSDSYYSKAITVLQQKTNVHFVGCWVQYFEGSTNVWPTFTPEPPYLLFHNMVNSSSLVYRRASFLQAGLNNETFVYGMEDYDSVMSMVEKGLGGVVLPELLFNYRVRKNSMARGFNRSNMSYLYQLLTQKHTQLYTTFAAEITNLLNVNGPGYGFENPTLDYHIHPGTNLFDRMVRKVKVKVKNQPVLRKLALVIYQKIKS